MKSDKNIREGYKRTAVGVIPEEWEVKSFKSVTTRIGDGIHSTPKYSIDGSYSFVNGTNLKNGTVVTDESTKRVSVVEYNKHKRELSNRTILMSINGTIGNLAYYNNEDIVLGKSACYLNIDEKYDLRYIYYKLGSYKTQNKFLRKTTGTTIRNLGINEIRKTKLPIPPLPEQQAIANCLTTWDSGIEKLTQLIAAKREQKKGLMQQLLTGKKRLDGFVGEWRKTEIRECLKYEQPSKYLTNKFNDIANDNKTPVLTANKSFILGYTDDSVDIYKNFPVIIFDDFTTASRYINFPFKIKSSAIKLLKAKKGFNLKFLFERLQLINHDISTHKRRWISEFQDMVLPIPSLIEQNAIADFSHVMDQEISLLEAKLAAMKEEKKGLMQVLLTGQKRLIDS